MFDTIIVGVDGRSGGRDACALARALSGPGTVLVLVAVGPDEPARWRGPSDGDRIAWSGDALAALESLRDDAGIDGELFALPDASVGRGLRRAAEDRHADLIVVGSSHRGRVGRILLGDDSRAVLHGASCPVAVAPRGYASTSAAIRRVGVGYDAFPEARAALEVGAAWAEAHHAHLAVYTAWDVSTVETNNLVYAVDAEAVMRDEERRAMRAADVALRAHPSIDRRVLRGSTASVLQAASQACDLLVVGSHGRGPVGRIVLGSASDHLVHHASCPVLVVPPPPDDRATAA